MKLERLSIKKLCLLIAAGALLSMLAITVALYVLTSSILVLLGGAALTACAIVWLFVLVFFFSKRLSVFTSDLCQTLDNMISGNEEPKQISDKETLFARISHRLSRLYGIMQESNRKVDEERQELQRLVSDISHQVKTPVSNLKMVIDTLLTKPVTDQERID
ncbi:MAG: sensor histidine kinase, partial [Acetatifactor sp.]|nr:sensor histidine kinase [Acetatifactor sp.]